MKMAQKPNGKSHKLAQREKKREREGESNSDTKDESNEPKPHTRPLPGTNPKTQRRWQNVDGDCGCLRREQKINWL